MDNQINIGIGTKKLSDGSIELFLENGIKEKFLCVAHPMRCEVTGNLLGYSINNLYFNGTGSVLHYVTKKVTNGILGLSYENL